MKINQRWQIRKESSPFMIFSLTIFSIYDFKGLSSFHRKNYKLGWNRAGDYCNIFWIQRSLSEYNIEVVSLGRQKSKEKWWWNILTSHKHHTYGKNLLCIRIGRYIAESYWRQTTKRKIQRCDITRLKHTTKVELELGTYGALWFLLYLYRRPASVVGIIKLVSIIS